LRILYHHRTRSRDGQRVHIDGLVGGLRRQGHEVLVVGPRAEEVAPPPAREPPAGRASRPRPLRELLEIAYNLLEVRALARAARRFRPDALYSRHTLFGFAPRIVRRMFALPWIVEVNAPLAWERSHYGGLYWQSLGERVETGTLNAADAVIVVTEVMRQLLHRQGVRGELFEVHPNGIDPVRLSQLGDPAALRRELDLEGATVLGFVGFVRDWNRLDRTYPFLVRRPDAVLWIVGDGPDRPRLEEEARRQGVFRQVRFAGAVPADQVMRHVAMFDVALLPEVTVYASPLKLLDYLAAGRAVLAPDRANLREVLVDGENAQLFDPDRDGAFDAALARLLDSPQLRAELGAAGRRTLDRLGLTWDHNAGRVVERFQAILAARAPREARG
jgi:glycosyltransferase involved in cell wall biosynthesis